MLHASTDRIHRRLLRLLFIVSSSCLADVLTSPANAYDSYDGNRAGLLVRDGVKSSSSERQYDQFQRQHHLYRRNALSPPSPIVVLQQGERVGEKLIANGADGVRRVPWHGLTELSDVLLFTAVVFCAVIGLLLFGVLVLSLREKLRHFSWRQQQRNGQLLLDYANQKVQCSAVQCGATSREKLQAKTLTSPIVIETGRVVVTPVPAPCVAVTVRINTSGRDTPYRSRCSSEEPSSLADKINSTSPTKPAVTKRKSLPVVTLLPTATMSTTTVEPANNSRPATTAIPTNSVKDDKENCLQKLPDEQSQLVEQSQNHLFTSHPSSQRIILKRQPNTEIAAYSSPGTPGPISSPSPFIQLLTPSSASSLSTSAATTTDNNATPTKDTSNSSGACGMPLSTTESISAARFGFSPRSIHSFTLQTGTYFRFPDVDDFTPTPRSVRSATKHHDARESSSTPPAVDACTEEEGAVGMVERVKTESSPRLQPKSTPVAKYDSQTIVAVPTRAAEENKKATDPTPDRESRAVHRMCAPMANRRVRLKSISLDSEGARLVEENLTSTIPVQELVGMAQQRSTGRFDEDDNNDNNSELEDHECDLQSNHTETEIDGSTKRAKRARNILNLRLNIPPLAASNAPLAPPGVSQSTGSMAKTTKSMVSVSGSVSNPTMGSTSTHTYQPHHHGMMAMLGAGGPGGGQMEESNEQFYFEYFDYGDEEDTDEEEEEEEEEDYDEEEYEALEDNNNNSTTSRSGVRGRISAGDTLPPVPKTPTLSQSKQKASSLDSDKLRLTTTVTPYGGSGGVESGAHGGSVSCSSVSHILSIAQSTSGHSMSTVAYSNKCQREQQQQTPHHPHQHGHFQQLQLHQAPGQLQQPPRRISSVSVPTTPKRYQYRTSLNHHYHHHQQQQPQQYAACGQSKVKPSHHTGVTMTNVSRTGETGPNGNGMDNARMGLRDSSSSSDAGGITLQTTSEPGRQSPVDNERTKGSSSKEETEKQVSKEQSLTPAKILTSGRSSILQRRGSNHSLTLNLDVYTRGGSVDFTSSSCSLYRGSYKNLHQMQSQSQLYQQCPEGSGSMVRVQCHQASPQQQQQVELLSGPSGATLSTAQSNASARSNVSNNNATGKKNLLQRRGSNTSLTLNLRSGLSAGGGGGGCVGGGAGGSAFGLNRFSSHNSLNTTHMSTLGTINSSAMGGSISGTGISAATGGPLHSSSLVRPAGSRKSLLERRNSNASLTLINVNQRTLSVSNCNLRGSICSLNSLLTTHTQNDPSGMMLEEDELDCTGARNGESDLHHHQHDGHHHHHHHQRCAAYNSHRGPEGGMCRFGSSMDAGMQGGNDGSAGGEGFRIGSGCNSCCGQHRGGWSAHSGRLMVAATQGTTVDKTATVCGSSGQLGDGQEEKSFKAMPAGDRGGGCGSGHCHAGSAKQRKFRSSDSLHNINSVREHALQSCERHLHGHGPVEGRQLDRAAYLTEGKMAVAVDNFQRSCQSSFDERPHFGSSENVKDTQHKLSAHRALFQKNPATVTSTSSANNLSELGTGTCCSSNCCCCCCCCCSTIDGTFCEQTGLIIKTGNLSISNSNIRNISTKPLSPQTTSEDFKIYLANIQFLQNASNVLTCTYLRKLHNFFSKTYRQMIADAPPGQRKESTGKNEQPESAESKSMILLHNDSLHHPPVCEDKAYEDEHKKMVLKIHQEFWDLPTNYQEKPLVFGSQAKNRYKTILPNEHSRVILDAERAVVPSSEPYINANYIKGPDYASNSYIATQGPLPNTIYEFWLMVHQNIARTASSGSSSLSETTFAASEFVQKIVMLTNFVENGRQKCAVYFPQEEGESLAFGSTADVDVNGVLDHKETLMDASERANRAPFPVCCDSGFFLVHNSRVVQRNGYTVRMLKIVYGAQKEIKTFNIDSRSGAGSSVVEANEFELSGFQAHHYWFPDWPDHRSPNDINVLLDLSLDVLGVNSANSMTEYLPEAPNSATEIPVVGTLEALRTATFGCAVLPIIHCSAGIGRTGCLIAILNGLRQLKLSVETRRIRQQQRSQQQSEQVSSLTLTAARDDTKPTVSKRKVVETHKGEQTYTLTEDDDIEQSFPLPPVPGSSEVRFNGRGSQLGCGQRGESGQVDILGIVCNLRLQRGGMVQNSEQYELIHRALCLYLEKLTREADEYAG